MNRLGSGFESVRLGKEADEIKRYAATKGRQIGGKSGGDTERFETRQDEPIDRIASSLRGLNRR